MDELAHDKQVTTETVYKRFEGLRELLDLGLISTQDLASHSTALLKSIGELSFSEQLSLLQKLKNNSLIEQAIFSREWQNAMKQFRESGGPLTFSVLKEKLQELKKARDEGVMLSQSFELVKDQLLIQFRNGPSESVVGKKRKASESEIKESRKKQKLQHSEPSERWICIKTERLPNEQHEHLEILCTFPTEEEAESYLAKYFDEQTERKCSKIEDEDELTYYMEKNLIQLHCKKVTGEEGGSKEMNRNNMDASDGYIKPLHFRI